MTVGIDSIEGASASRGIGSSFGGSLMQVMQQMMNALGVEPSKGTLNAMQEMQQALDGAIAAASQLLQPNASDGGAAAEGLAPASDTGAVDGAPSGTGMSGLLQGIMQLLALMLKMLEEGQGAVAGDDGASGQGPSATPQADQFAQGLPQSWPGDEQTAPASGVGGAGSPGGGQASPPTGSVFGPQALSQNAPAPANEPASTGGGAPVGERPSAPMGGDAWTRPQTAPLSASEGRQVAEQYISNLQKDFGLSREQAAGVVGNLWHESAGMNSGMNQGGQVGAPSGNYADDNANGYGISQWGGVRKQGLMDYAHAHGLDPSSQAANYGFLKQELQGDYAGALAAVKASGSTAEATQAFSSQYLKPSDPQMASRLNDAEQLA